MFTIHGIDSDHYVPLVYFLLPNKLLRTYQIAFNYIKEVCNRMGLTFAPTTVTVDFEIAIHKAIENVLPDAKIKGCRFHLGQAW